MITQAILNVLGHLLEWLAGLLPELSEDLTDNLNGVPANVQEIAASVSHLDPIVPLDMAALGLTLSMSAIVVVYGVMAVRGLISLVSGGGGSV